MASLMELVERVEKRSPVDPVMLEVYEKSDNSAEAFLSNRASAVLKMRQVHGHLRKCLEAIDFSDWKVLDEYLTVCDLLSLGEERVGPTAWFGASAIARGDYSLGIEAIQSAAARGGEFLAKQENCVWVAEEYQIAAQGIGWSTPVGFDWENSVIRLGFVVSGIEDGDATSRLLMGLGENLHPARCEFYVYSTEAKVRRGGERFAQPSYAGSSWERGANTLEKLRTSGAGVWVAGMDGNALSTAGALAEKMVLDRLDAVIYGTTLADAAAALTISWPVARAKIDWCQGTALYGSEINAVVYRQRELHATSRKFWEERGVQSRYLFEGMAMPRECESGSRAEWRIPASAVVLVTGAQKADSLSDEFIEIVIDALRANRQAIYLILGSGDFSRQRRRFERAGVAGRVGNTGEVEVLGICDAYLSANEDADSEWVLKAMALGKPVLLGETDEKYASRLTKLIRHPQQRRILGQTMQRQYQEHFSARRMAQEIEELCENLLRKPVAAAQAA
jgi:hypothetical protein